MELPGRWHNGSAFVFCQGDCPFKSEPSSTSAHAYGKVTDCTPVTKRLACVAPEVDLRECTLHLPVAPQKGHVSAKTLKKYMMEFDLYLRCKSWMF